ncbi:MAG: TolC family protein [Bdellovibrionota bacterium]
MKARVLAAVLGISGCVSVFAQDVSAPQTSAATDRLDFDGFYKRALEKGARIQESAAQLKVSDARAQLARAQSFPTMQLEAIAGPSPSFTGNALESNTSFDRWGVAFQNKIEIIQPLYAFGALGKLREAASAAQEAERGRHEREKLLLKQDIAKLYYGYQLAFELREVVQGLQNQITKARDEAEKMRDHRSKNAPSATDIDRLDMVLAELTARSAEAQKFMDLAKLGMAVEIGNYGGQNDVRWARANLKRREADLKELGFYQEISHTKRPEYQALRKESEARDLLVEAEAGRFYPTIFAGARWTFASNSVSTDQPSVFANDPYNQNTAMAGIGIRWNIFSADARAKVAAVRADAIKTHAKNDALLRNLDADVEKNWQELKYLKVATEQKALVVQSARRVYLDMLGGFALGSQKAKDLLESIGSLAGAQKASLDAVFEENLAWVRLEASTGQDLSNAP